MNQLRNKPLGAMAALAMGAAAVTVVASGPAVAATCSYPSSIVTTTTASGPTTITYGRSAHLTATVSSNSGTPTGNVTFAVTGTSRSRTNALSSGSTGTWIGKFLPAQATYSYTADYAGDCDWAASSGGGSFNVVKAGTSTTVLAPNITTGSLLSVNVKVVSNTSGVPRGRVHVALWHRGQLRRVMNVTLIRGKASANFGNVARPGRWRAVATYLGAHNFVVSRSANSFFVS